MYSLAKFIIDTTKAHTSMLYDVNAATSRKIIDRFAIRLLNRTNDLRNIIFRPKDLKTLTKTLKDVKVQVIILLIHTKLLF